MKKDSNSFPVSTYGIPILFLLITISILWYNYTLTTVTDYFPTEIQVSSPNSDFKPLQTRSCRFDSCFDINRCEFNKQSLIQVYTYPTTQFYYTENESNLYLNFNTSLAYQSMVYTIQQSPFYVDDPSRACVFIPAIDTLIHSDNNPEYISLALKQLPYWDKGMNHLVFSFLTSLPNSLPSVSTDRASVASPSLLYSEYRTGFDISLPVYNFPERLASPRDPSLSKREIFLLILIPLEFDLALEDTLQQIQNEAPHRITIVDFCQEERRCVEEEIIDYSDVLLRSKFCLLLPGYRYTTPDLLDVIMQGCVPVYTHADYMLPFEEVLDWRLVGVPLRPAFLPRILSILEGVGEEEWSQKQRQGLRVWTKYFSSLGRIVLTTLLILNERVFPTHASSFEEWNLLETDLRRVNPLLMHPIPAADTGFTAVIFSNNRDDSLKKLLNTLDSVSTLKKVIIIWNERGTIPSSDWELTYIPVEVVIPEDLKPTNRFLPLSQIQTDCVMSLDDDVTALTADEISFGYQAWREFPDRLVGYHSSYHGGDQQFEFPGQKKVNIISTKAAFYHNHYQRIFISEVPSAAIQWVDTFHLCEDVVMSLLVSRMTNKPPIRLKYNTCDGCGEDLYTRVEKSCLKELIRFFHPIELKSSEFHVEQV